MHVLIFTVVLFFALLWLLSSFTLLFLLSFYSGNIYQMIAYGHQEENCMELH